MPRYFVTYGITVEAEDADEAECLAQDREPQLIGIELEDASLEDCDG